MAYIGRIMPGAYEVIFCMVPQPTEDMIDRDALREIDETLLGYLDDGRVTPAYCKARLGEAGEDYSRGYVQERLARFVEHGHCRNLYGTGLYDLVDDPRESGGDDGG